MSPLAGIAALCIFGGLVVIIATRWLLRINDAMDLLTKIESHLREIEKNIKKP
jgi:hypothetical protein